MNRKILIIVIVVVVVALAIPFAIYTISPLHYYKYVLQR